MLEWAAALGDSTRQLCECNSCRVLFSFSWQHCCALYICFRLTLASLSAVACLSLRRARQGVENKLADVRETETCVYEFKFSTPAACEDGAAGASSAGGKQEL